MLKECQSTEVLWCCWLSGRKSIWPVRKRVVRHWHGYLSGARCKWLAYGLADATAMFYPSGTGLPGLSLKKAVKCLLLLMFCEIDELGYFFIGTYCVDSASQPSSSWMQWGYLMPVMSVGSCWLHLLIVTLHFVLGLFGPLLNSGTSKHSTCCGMQWSSVHSTCLKVQKVMFL